MNSVLPLYFNSLTVLNSSLLLRKSVLTVFYPEWMTVHFVEQEVCADLHDDGLGAHSVHVVRTEIGANGDDGSLQDDKETRSQQVDRI